MAPKIDKSGRKYHAKKSAKNDQLKNPVFWCNVAFFVEKASDFVVFWDHFESLPACFFIVFLGLRFWLDFYAFLVKNIKKAKNEKVAFVL